VKLKLDREQLTILGLVASGLVIAVAGALLIVLPQRSHVASLQRGFAQTQNQILSMRVSRASASLHASELYQLSRAMPATDDMPGILLALSRVAQQSSIQLVSVHPSIRLTLADGSAAVPLQVAVAGSYTGVSHFLRILRSQVSVTRRGVTAGSRLFVADQVNLTAGSTTPTTGASTPTGEVNATLNLVAFDYGAPPALDATAGITAAPGAGGTSSSAPSASAAGATTGGH
jgi:hypothetical protein